jgi:hypothetical protein
MLLCGLTEVANGGISSFALTNMVLAHIMDELRVRAWAQSWL